MVLQKLEEQARGARIESESRAANRPMIIRPFHTTAALLDALVDQPMAYAERLHHPTAGHGVHRSIFVSGMGGAPSEAPGEDDVEDTAAEVAVLLQVDRQGRLVTGPGIGGKERIVLEIELRRERDVQRFHHPEVDMRGSCQSRVFLQ